MTDTFTPVPTAEANPYIRVHLSPTVAAEADPYSHRHSHAHVGMDEPHNHLHQHTTANHDDATHAHGHPADDIEATQPTSSDVHVNGPMKRKGKPQPVEKDGKVKKVKTNPFRKMGEHFANLFADWYGADLAGGDSAFLPASSSYPEDGDNDADDGAQPKLEKADDRVNYRDATAPKVSCLTCRFFLDDDGACRIVEGYIAPTAVCDLQAPLVPLMASEDGTLPFQLAARQLRFTGAPDWIPYLPKPGTYTHPTYGKIDLSLARLEHFVENFTAKIYGQDLPLDAEHELKTSGAVGWIKTLRQNADGSVDAKVEWNDRGRAFLEGDRFRYISPEWFDEWPDPVTGHKYKDILIGGAICTRPFFKEGSLRALAASDPTVEVRGIFTGRVPQSPPTQSPGDVAVGMTEQEIQEFQELKTFRETTQDQLKQLVEANKAKDAIIEATQAEAKQAREQSAAIIADARRRRFTDHVNGRSDANGYRWPGDIQQTVSLMEMIADTKGEDSDYFKNFVSHQNAQAAQIAAGELMREHGRDAEPVSGSPAARAFAEVTKTLASDPKADPTETMAKFFADNPQMYEQYRQQTAVKV